MTTSSTASSLNPADEKAIRPATSYEQLYDLVLDVLKVIESDVISDAEFNKKLNELEEFLHSDPQKQDILKRIAADISAT